MDDFERFIALSIFTLLAYGFNRERERQLELCKSRIAEHWSMEKDTSEFQSKFNQYMRKVVKILN